MNLAPWLCWLFPFLGIALTLISAKVSERLRDLTAVSFPFLSLVMALLLIPDLLNGIHYDKMISWTPVPNLKPIGIGVLVDPLSIVLANVVALVSALIMVYSIKYMRNEPGVTRYWCMMNLFIGGMLMLILADNFIQMLLGWKIVGFCSYALIGHYYRDERKYWIGGPPPARFFTPSYCGLKALITTTIGDVSLIAGMMILYAYSGTFNFMELYQTLPSWTAALAKTPGMLGLISVLLLGGPLAKSAQFPLHEWLPEAMAGPAPVSALIHAATMVKAGIYLVARLFPIFFYWCWSARLPEAFVFFAVAAAIGAFTAFLGGTQAMVAKELKKALAYSTISQLGYMMLALGVAGLSLNSSIIGYTASIAHLISHALFKAALFLSAGSVIHATGTIYMEGMKVKWGKMPLTYISMWIAVLSLSGLPPLSGFWSKDLILLSCLEAGRPWLFIAAIVTVAITCFYSVRFMGLVFHKRMADPGGADIEEASPVMWVPYVVLACLTVIYGIGAPWFMSYLQGIFGGFLAEAFKLPLEGGAAVEFHPITPLTSIAMLLLGGVPAVMLYIAHRLDPKQLVERYRALGLLYNFFWNRWYINSTFYLGIPNLILSLRPAIQGVIEDSFDSALNLGIPNLILSLRPAIQGVIEDSLDSALNLGIPNLILSLRPAIQGVIEDSLDSALNLGIPNLFSSIYYKVRGVQTGVLSYNMLYIALFIVIVIAILLLGGI